MSNSSEPQTPPTVVGCLLDVSGSMEQALESGRPDERATERLDAVLRAALKLAQSEQRHDPDALMFTGLFGLREHNKCPPVVDLCAVADRLLEGYQDGQTGRQLLIALANQRNQAHITKYIKAKLTDHEARIVYLHLEQHPEDVDRFVEAIPSEESIKTKKKWTARGGTVLSMAGGFAAAGPIGLVLGAVAGGRHLKRRRVCRRELQGRKFESHAARTRYL